MRLCINMLIFTHNLGNWLINQVQFTDYAILQDNSTVGSLTYAQSTNVHHTRDQLTNIFTACADG